ncbi:hypothetical protein HP10700_08676 [Helicobacter pylori 10700]|nr:hypothetical protein HP10700_08676 [Helicobacter pylori 10700]
MVVFHWYKNKKTPYCVVRLKPKIFPPSLPCVSVRLKALREWESKPIKRKIFDLSHKL